MIRKLLNGDIDRIADIWLKTNLKAHYFISNQYWKSNYELVKEIVENKRFNLLEALAENIAEEVLIMVLMPFM